MEVGLFIASCQGIKSDSVFCVIPCFDTLLYDDIVVVDYCIKPFGALVCNVKLMVKMN